MSEKLSPRKISISKNNSKIKETGKALGKKAACFDLPAGHTCPMANLCHSQLEQNAETGKWSRKDYGKFVCYATKAEIYPTVRNARWNNWEVSKGTEFVQLVVDAIKKAGIEIMRIHSSGDFYTYEYFLKWVEIARALPGVAFYGYTKQASFVRKLQELDLPNFKLVYSEGGKMDAYAEKHNLPTCTVYTGDGTPKSDIICEGHNTGNDHEDYSYIMAGESFSLTLH